MNRPEAPETALLRSRELRVLPEWIDYNGHLNMAFYNVLFDRGVDDAFVHFGLGPNYLQANQASFFTAEVHVCYLRELAEGDAVFSTFHLLDFDDKRAHFFQSLYHAGEGWLSATSEQMSLHVDMAAKKVAPWHPDVREKLAAVHAAQSSLPWPERAGRSIGIRRK